MGKNRDHSKFPNAITVLDNGNVGIGNTNPFSGATTLTGLAISDRGGLFKLAVNDVVYLSNNLYYDGANWKRITANGGMFIQLESLDGGTLRIFGAATGTAGSNATTLDRLMINSSGNVGIGTGSPGYRLDVSTSASGAVFAATSTYTWTGGYLDHSAFLAPNITGGAVSLAIGKSASTFNVGKIVFNYAGSGSSSNSLGLGFYDGDNKLVIVADGTVRPGSNGTQNLGTSSLRWGTVYTSDLDMSNGIGDYTIVEGREDLFLYNNITKKVFKFALIEVDPKTATPKKS